MECLEAEERMMKVTSKNKSIIKFPNQSVSHNIYIYINLLFILKYLEIYLNLIQYNNTKNFKL